MNNDLLPGSADQATSIRIRTHAGSMARVAFLNPAVWRVQTFTSRMEQKGMPHSRVFMQEEELPAISRFACARIGDRVFIHMHRSTDSILSIDVANPASPVLASVPVKADAQHGTPSSRSVCQCHHVVNGNIVDHHASVV